MEYSGGRHEEEWKGGCDNDTAGMGRSYECVFCKRGFTTAQALGGHMNIHRKDRAKNSNSNIRPSPSTGLVATTTHDVSVLHRAKADDVYLKPYSPALQSYPPTYHHLHGYFPASPAQYCHGQQETYHYGAGHGSSVPGGCSWSLSLQVGSSRVDDDDDEDDDDDRNGYEDRRGGFVEGDQELDLELRLGHGHGHGHGRP